MSLEFADFVLETTTTTGTGTYSLAGATTGFRTFVAGVGDGNTTYYSVNDGTDWEVGLGTVTDASPDTLARTSILASSNGGSAVNWGAGTKDVRLVNPASVIDTVLQYTRGSGVITDATTTRSSDRDVDAGKLILFTSASATVFTIEPESTSAFDNGDEIHVARMGTGTLTITAGTGVTINKAAKFSANTLDEQYSVATVKKTGTNTWLLFGDLTLA